MVRTAPLLLAAALGSCSAGLDAALSPEPPASVAVLPEPVEAVVPVVRVVAGRPDTLATRGLLGTDAPARFGRHPDVTVRPVGADSVVVYARPRFAGLAVVPFDVGGAAYALAVQAEVHPEVTFAYEPVARPLQVTPRPEVGVVGTFNGWRPEPLADEDGDGTLERTVALAPGEYAYRLVVDGEEALDPANADTVTDTSGTVSSALTVAPAVAGRLHLRLAVPEAGAPGVLRLAIHRLGAAGEDALAGVGEGGVVALLDNRLLPGDVIEADYDGITLDLGTAEAGTQHLRVAVYTDSGLVSNWVAVPLADGRLADD